jgi:hypothetical protein
MYIQVLNSSIDNYNSDKWYNSNKWYVISSASLSTLIIMGSIMMLVSFQTSNTYTPTQSTIVSYTTPVIAENAKKYYQILVTIQRNDNNELCSMVYRDKHIDYQYASPSLAADGFDNNLQINEIITTWFDKTNCAFYDNSNFNSPAFYIGAGIFIVLFILAVLTFIILIVTACHCVIRNKNNSVYAISKDLPVYSPKDLSLCSPIDLSKHDLSKYDLLKDLPVYSPKDLSVCSSIGFDKPDISTNSLAC